MGGDCLAEESIGKVGTSSFECPAGAVDAVLVDECLAVLIAACG